MKRPTPANRPGRGRFHCRARLLSEPGQEVIARKSAQAEAYDRGHGTRDAQPHHRAEHGPNGAEEILVLLLLGYFGNVAHGALPFMARGTTRWPRVS